MAINLEIAFYNSFILAGGKHSTNSSKPGKYHVEEARIKGGFNATQVDVGARAYSTDEEYDTIRRINAMIHSGIYNSKTKVNKTNEFAIGEAITRAVDIENGSIQKLHAEDTNLNIFQENKVSRALIDKDAIFTAEGGQLTVSGAKVIGQVAAYAGKYGISTNPESFAIFGTRKYFADKNRGVILRLSQDGLTPISAAGMKDFFRDNLKLVAAAGSSGFLYGMYDEVKDQYVLSMQASSINLGKKTNATNTTLNTSNSGFVTLGYSEKSKGWVSFYSYKPTFGTSMTNEFYTFNQQDLFKHYASSHYNRFYAERGTNRTIDVQYSDPSYVKYVMNDAPSSTKSFLTIGYEGTTGWSMESATAENVMKEGYSTESQPEEAYKIPEKGVTILDENSMQQNVGFELKESKYYKELKQKTPYENTYFDGDFNANTINTTTGIKGYHAVFELQYWKATDVTNQSKVELFGVLNEINGSS